MRKTKVRSFLVAAGVSLALAFTLSCSGDEASAIEGIDGNHGKDGVDGVDGNHGIDGKDGADGVDGNHGIDGKDGADGVDGNHGVDGKDGADGIDGADGNHGNHGINGEDGKDGEKGEAGAKGDKGDAGADGKDGADGTGCDMKDDGAYIVVKCGSDEKKLAKAMCGIKAYDPEAEVCKRGVLWPLCGTVAYDPKEDECENGALKSLPFCGTVQYNPKKEQICAEGDVVKSLCGEIAYLPSKYICENGGLIPLCEGVPYDPDVKLCKENGVLVTKSLCGTTGYDKDEKICDERDYQTYKFLEMGTQTWLAENLNYDVEGGVCHSNDPANCDKYGRLYNFEAASSACPSGWRLPTRAEWTTLLDYANGTNYDCSDVSKTCSHPGMSKLIDVFSLLPTGAAYSNNLTNGEIMFQNIVQSIYRYWSSTIHHRYSDEYEIISYVTGYAGIFSSSGSGTRYYSVRCIQYTTN